MALGADRPSVLRLVLRECLSMALAGTLVGVAAALALSRYATTLLYQISPRDPGAFIASATAMIFLALLAAGIPARRAVRIDPARALRQE